MDKRRGLTPLETARARCVCDFCDPSALPTPTGNPGELGGAAAGVLLGVSPGCVHRHAGQQVLVAGRGQHALLFPALPQLCSHPFFLSFERLLLHAVCQYLDLISASECPLPGRGARVRLLKPGSRVNPTLQETEAPRTQAFVLHFFGIPNATP